MTPLGSLRFGFHVFVRTITLKGVPHKKDDMSSDSRVGLPEITSNNLRDLCKCLEQGDIVVLLTGNKRYMMPYCKPEVPSQDPNTFRVIYMDIGKMESLGLGDEWPWYFESSAGAVKYQEGDLIPRILAEDLPHSFHFSLGF